MEFPGSVTARSSSIHRPIAREFLRSFTSRNNNAIPRCQRHVRAHARVMHRTETERAKEECNTFGNIRPLIPKLFPHDPFPTLLFHARSSPMDPSVISTDISSNRLSIARRQGSDCKCLYKGRRLLSTAPLFLSRQPFSLLYAILLATILTCRSFFYCGNVTKDIVGWG